MKFCSYYTGYLPLVRHLSCWRVYRSMSLFNQRTCALVIASSTWNSWLWAYVLYLYSPPAPCYTIRTYRTRLYSSNSFFFCVYLIRSSNFDQYGNAHVHPSSNHPLLPLQPNELNKLSTRSSLGSSLLCANKLEIRYQSTASLLLQRVVRSVWTSPP